MLFLIARKIRLQIADCLSVRGTVGANCTHEGERRHTDTSPSQRRLLCLLLTAAMALLACTAQAQVEPLQDTDAVSLSLPDFPPHFAVNRSFTYTLPAATGFIALINPVYTFSPLPSGVNFDVSSRRLYGTPTELETTPMTYRVEAGLNARRFYATATFNFVVRNAVTQLHIVNFNKLLYRVGESIEVRVFFLQSVTVRGSPILELSLDSTTVQMNYLYSTSEQRGLVFRYIIESGDEDTNGVSILANALQLNGGSIVDAKNNPVDLNMGEYSIHNSPENKVDGIPPQVTNLTFTTSPPDHIFAGLPAWYHWSDPDIKVRVDFAEPVTVTGSPRLRLDIGERRVMARYDASVHNTNDRSVGFAYQVQPGDLDRDGISIAADALAAVGTNKITDALGNHASLDRHAIHNDPDQRVDAVKPQISGLSIISRPADGDTYRAGETIQLRVTFDEDLYINPYSFEKFEPITLDSGVVMAEVTIDPQSHDSEAGPYHTINEMVFHYTVQAGDYDADGISYLGTPRSGRTIFLAAVGRYDLASNFLNIDIPDLIITNAEEHKVDGGGPRVTRVSITSEPENGHTYWEGEKIIVTLTFNEPLVGDVDNLRLTLNLDSDAVIAQKTELSDLDQTALFTYTVQDGNLDEDGISIGADALSLTGGRVTDSAGTPLILSLAGHTITNLGDHKVDAATPKVVGLSIASTPAEGDVYRLHEMIRVRLTLDKKVVPSGLPTLSVPLIIGAVTQMMTFSDFANPTPSPIEVTYQVQGGDLDTNGISVGEGGLKVTGGSLTDAVGNPLDLSLVGYTISNAPAHQVGAVPRFTAADAIPDQTYTVGQSVSLTLPEAIGGAAPLRYNSRATILPGLEFDATTRTLFGTPSALMETTELALMAVDAVLSVAFLRFNVTIVAAPSFGDVRIDDQIYTVTETVTDLQLPVATSALPLAYALVSLPDGLSFDGETRILSGTPTAPTVATELELMATDVNGVSARLRFQVTVVEPLTFGNTSIADLVFTVNMPPIDILLPAATGGVAPLTYSLFPQIPAGLSFDQTTRRLIGVPSSATEAEEMIYTVMDSNGALATIRFTLSVVPPLRFVQASIQDQTFTVGQPVRLPLPTDTLGGYGDKQYTLTEDALPNWLSYDKASHILSGTPLVAADAIPLRWQVSDANSVTDTMAFSLRMVDPPSFAESLTLRLRHNKPLPDTPAEQIKLPAARDGTSPLVYTLEGDIPPGLAFDPRTRALSGTPADIGVSILTYTATDAVGAFASGDFVFTVVDTVKPTVTGVSITSMPKHGDTYTRGERITMRMDFSEPVVTKVSPKPIPAITLIIGDKSTRMRFPFPADSNDPVMSLEGSYKVREGDLDTGGISAHSLGIIGESIGITDVEDNVLTLDFADIPDNPAHKVDGVVSKVSFVLVAPLPANHNTYRLGEEIKVLMAFDSPIQLILGQLSLQLTLDSSVVTAQNSKKHDATSSYGTSLEFSYVVQAGDLDENGLSLGINALMLVPGESVTDDSGNPVNLSLLKFAFTDEPTRKVDGVPPDIVAPIAYTTEATATLTPLDPSRYGTATSTDGTARITDNAPTAFPLGPTTITWTATDSAGNKERATQVVTVQDTTAPLIALLGANPQTIEFGTAYTELGATATDAVDDNDELTTQIAAASTVDTGTVGDYTVTYTVSDKATNEATPVTRTVIVEDTTVVVIRTVSVEDTMAPGITAPATMTFEATATRTPLDRSDYGTATSTDPNARITDNAPDTFPMGPTPITWTATDTNSLSSIVEQIITIIDTTKPVITLLNDNPVGNTVEFGMPYRDPGATATDLVDDDVAMTTRIAMLSTVNVNQVGTYRVTYDMLDTAGNAADTVTRTVIVEDTTKPDISAPPAMTFEARAGMTPLSQSDFGTATSSDDTVKITHNAPASFPMGDTMITWTAIDINELSSSAQQMITVEDTTPPTITLLGDNPLTLEVGRHYIEPGATAVDSMAGELTGRIVIDDTDLDTNRVGTYTVTYTVADTTGNEAQASRSIQVLAAPDFADLNRIILSEAARAMADQNVHAVARRLEQVGGKAARSASLGGQSSLAGIITAQGRALADDQFNIKRLLADTDFVLPLGTAEGASEGAEATAEATSRLTFWGAGDYRNISDSDQLTWDGDLFSLHLGLDTQLNASLVAGVALSWNQVALDYSNYTSTPSPDRAGRIASSGDYALEMTSIHPYVGWNLGQVDFWATLGYGEGELESTDEAAPLVRNLSSELNLQTLALGASGPLLAAGTNNLRMKVEALRTELEVVGNEQLAALSLDVSRLRMTLEATGTWSLDSGAQLGLLMEGGLRYDGGAGKTGSGTEIGSGLRYVSAANRLTLEAKARGVAHYKGGIEEWGLSGLIKYQGAADGRGLSFSLMPAYGETTSSNLQQLWQPGLGGPEYGDPGRSDYAPRIDLRLDYGMLAPGARVHLTPYGEMTWGDGSDTYRLGLRWQVDSLFDVKLVAERRERLGATEHSILLEGSISY